MIFLVPLSSFAGRVRTLPTNSQEMPVIHLMTGRSTVLRFPSPPKKVIIGNQNYFNIEFIESDVTLQPLSLTTSNMFVYGDSFTFGFILKVNSTSEYDDLVFIRNKVPTYLLPKIEKTVVNASVLKKDLAYLIMDSKKKQLELQEVGVFKWNESLQSFYTDIFITLKNLKIINTDSIKVQILSQNQDLNTIKPVFEEDHLLLNKKGRVRVFAKISPKQTLNLKIQLAKEEMTFHLKWKK